jgi:hypothetical protein
MEVQLLEYQLKWKILNHKFRPDNLTAIFDPMTLLVLHKELYMNLSRELF